MSKKTPQKKSDMSSLVGMYSAMIRKPPKEDSKGRKMLSLGSNYNTNSSQNLGGGANGGFNLGFVGGFLGNGQGSEWQPGQANLQNPVNQGDIDQAQQNTN